MKRIAPDVIEAACRAEDLDRFWNLSQDLLVIATPEGEWVRANPALERILGWTVDDVHTLGRSAITHPDDRDRTRAQAVKLGSGEAVLHFENRVLHKNGGYRWLSWTATPAEGLLYCVARDITAEKIKTAGIQRRDRILASLTESIVLTDAQRPNNPIIYVNPAFERITGYSSADALGRNCKFLQGHGTDPAVVRTIATALARRQEFRGRILNYRKDGHRFVNELSIGPVLDEHGELTHFIGITSDVAEQVELEERLVQSEARYRLLADNATDLISRIGLDGTRLYVSPSSRDILGYEPDEIMGKPIMELAHPDDRRSIGSPVPGTAALLRLTAERTAAPEKARAHETDLRGLIVVRYRQMISPSPSSAKAMN
jgi:PAS domain S-box-containing protein